MYVETIKSKRNGKTYETTLVRETYRDSGKIKHRTLANISKFPKSIRTVVKQAISGKGNVRLEDVGVSSSKEFGGSYALLGLAKEIGLDRILYSRPDKWRQNALAMIVGRILWQGSKLSLTNMYMDSALWELTGHDADVRPDVQKSCYDALDKLLSRQSAVQKALVEKHLSDGCLILYDLTNSWLEGEYSNSELAAYGKGKGGKHGYKQIAIGLITNRNGCPVAVEVFKGNASDQSTVWGQAERLANQYGVTDAILAGDRGVLTPKRI